MIVLCKLHISEQILYTLRNYRIALLLCLACASAINFMRRNGNVLSCESSLYTIKFKVRSLDYDVVFYPN